MKKATLKIKTKKSQTFIIPANVTIKATRKKKNPYLAESSDGLNQAYGQTKEEALLNLENGIEQRRINGN